MADDGVDVGQRLARALRDLYATAELNLITAVTTALRTGMDATGLHFSPRAFRALRATAQKVTSLLARDSTAMVSQVMEEAVRLGSETALADLAAEVKTLPTVSARVEQIQQDLAGKLRQTEFRTVRWPVDVYQQAIMPQVAHVLAGEMSPLEAQQAGWEKLASNGVTGFVDSTGRGWELQSYVEMATRTATQRAWNEQHTTEFQAAGVDLVMVSTAPDCCELCAPFQSAVLSIGDAPPDQPDVMSVDEARGDGLQHYNCFPGYQPVSAATGIIAADTRWYEGELVIIHTASGRDMSVTPNHPVLTPEGWVSAGALMEGQNVIAYRPEVEAVGPGNPDHQGVETLIGQVFESVRQAVAVQSVLVPGSPEQFHGDGTDTDVHVVTSDRLLRDDGQPATFERTSEGEFLAGGVRLPSLTGNSTLLDIGVSSGNASNSVVGSSSQPEALVGARVGHPQEHGFAATTDRNTGSCEPQIDGSARHAEFTGDLLYRLTGVMTTDDIGVIDNDLVPELDTSFVESARDHLDGDAKSYRHLLDGLAGFVSADQIVHIDRHWSSTHVYNLQTGGGWYTASSIIVHNCRCALTPYFEGVTEPFPTPVDPMMREDREQLRYLERGVRQWKRREAAALTPEAKKAAGAKVRQWQGRIRQHVASTNTVRKPYREAI